MNFEVIKKSDNSRYAKGKVIRLFNLGPIALFGIFKLTTSSGKHLEDISHAHIVSVMYKLLTSSGGSDDLSIGFDQDRGRRQQELLDNKNTKVNYHELSLRMFLDLQNIKKKLLLASIMNNNKK